MTVANFTGMMRGRMGSRIGSAIEKHKQHPALLGYYLCDEPDHNGWNVTPREIREAHDIASEADPDHPSVVLVMGWHRSMAYQYADTATILASDPYSETDMDKPVRSTLWMEDAQAAKQPVWTILQAGWDKTPPLTVEALECQTYASIASGADAILWFQLQWCKRYPKQWEKIKAMSLELQEIHDPLCGEEPADRQPTFSDPRVIGVLKKTKNGSLLVTVNKTLDDVGVVRVTLPGTGDQMAKEYFVGGDTKIDAGTLTVNYAPGQRHVYRLADSCDENLPITTQHVSEGCSRLAVRPSTSISPFPLGPC